MKKISVTLDTLTESGVYPAWGECETIEIECEPADLEKEIETLKNDFIHALVANESYEFSNEAGFDLVKPLSKENVLLKVAATWEQEEEQEELFPYHPETVSEKIRFCMAWEPKEDYPDGFPQAYPVSLEGKELIFFPNRCGNCENNFTDRRHCPNFS